jgi:hypothetical protein
MDISIKSFDVDMKVKTKGVELAVYDPNGGKFVGDLVITKTNLIWCRGKITRKNGKAITWADFAAYMDSR